MDMYRQGDVLIVPVKKAPSHAVAQKAENGRVILARGEVTGHHHSFEDDGNVALLEAAPGELYLKVDALSMLTHQEHGSIAVTPGVGRVIIQRQYTPAEIRNVAD